MDRRAKINPNIEYIPSVIGNNTMKIQYVYNKHTITYLYNNCRNCFKKNVY